jgi:short-subunit dehydrogenase
MGKETHTQSRMAKNNAILEKKTNCINNMPNIVITGATKGIGKAIAEIFVKNGANVCVCSRSETNLKQLHDELKKLNPASEIHYRATDVSKKEEVMAFGEFVKSHFNKVDVLVNNAGVFLGGQMTDEKDGQMEFMMNVNFYSAYHLTRALLPVMLPNKSGYIFNICSIASFMAYPHGGAYSVSKFALHGFSKSLREEMKPHNIKVSSVMPGATLTHSWEGVDLPEARFMPAEDVAKIIYSAYTLSDRTVIEDIVLRPQLGDI